jgi:hypothetical protein
MLNMLIYAQIQSKLCICQRRFMHWKLGKVQKAHNFMQISGWKRSYIPRYRLLSKRAHRYEALHFGSSGFSFGHFGSSLFSRVPLKVNSERFHKHNFTIGKLFIWQIAKRANWCKA